MAQFKGTVEEFTKYIGAYTRIKVTAFASAYKRTINICEGCGTDSFLEIAHVKGKERPVLIAQILSEYMDEENCVEVDLEEFENRFIYIHFPLKSTVKILCKSCHRAYDKKVKPEVFLKANKDEGRLIEKLTSNQMNKAKAFRLLKLQNFEALTNANTIFSNLVGLRDRWWLQPSNEKFKEPLYIILHNNLAKVLNVFHLPANTISNPEDIFQQRNDSYRKNCSDIWIPVSNSKFVNTNGFDFTEFLVKKIEY